MAIERISELPWASFEWQLHQKIKAYDYENSSAHVDTTTGDNPVNANGRSLKCWKFLDVNQDTPAEGEFADIIYGIQQQLVCNVDVMLGCEKVEGADWYRNVEIEPLFWNDVALRKVGENYENVTIDGYEDSIAGRTSQLNDSYFPKHESFKPDPGDYDEDTNCLSPLPKTHSAKSLLEISEYIGPDNSQARWSHYVSRKVSLGWLYNVIKAISDLKFIFRRLICGVDTTDVSCAHSEAEEDPDDTSNDNVSYKSHTFKRSCNPIKDGRLSVYGNAELNGCMTTFHSKVRFHDEVRVWDSLNVYGQSFFSKDIDGTAMRVRWADIAEYYASDKDYEPGTLVRFGGENEITIADSVANAVVTTKPGVVLNSQGAVDGFPVAIALGGRTPVKVWGKVKKFDELVPSQKHPGWAKKKESPDETTIARALEDRQVSDCDSIYKKGYSDTILCATSFRI